MAGRVAYPLGLPAGANEDVTLATDQVGVARVDLVCAYLEVVLVAHEENELAFLRIARLASGMAGITDAYDP